MSQHQLRITFSSRGHSIAKVLITSSFTCTHSLRGHHILCKQISAIFDPTPSYLCSPTYFIRDFQKVQFQLRQFFATLCAANYFFDISGESPLRIGKKKNNKSNYPFEFWKEREKLKKWDIIWGNTEFALVEWITTVPNFV